MRHVRADRAQHGRNPRELRRGGADHDRDRACLSARRGPPLTGASISATPRSASSAAMVRVAAGSPDVWSTIIPPGRMPQITPVRFLKIILPNFS